MPTPEKLCRLLSCTRAGSGKAYQLTLSFDGDPQRYLVKQGRLPRPLRVYLNRPIDAPVYVDYQAPSDDPTERTRRAVAPAASRDETPASQARRQTFRSSMSGVQAGLSPSSRSMRRSSPMWAAPSFAAPMRGPATMGAISTTARTTQRVGFLMMRIEIISSARSSRLWCRSSVGSLSSSAPRSRQLKRSTMGH